MLEDYEALLQRALAQAQRALFLSSPNPRVGCVLSDGHGLILGEGFTQQAGGPHAEIMALRDAALRGHSTQGCTAYVTLEPCSHQGRTGPCCDALRDAGVARVVTLSEDPNPQVAGAGLSRLRAHGVLVEMLPTDHHLVQVARELNLGFFSRMVRGKPWVRLKLASSLDGRSALPDGRSQWITGPDARRDTHAWRARADAILTGVGTVLADNPKLDVRLVDAPRQPRLIVLDSGARTPPDASIFIASRACCICVAAEYPNKPSWPAGVAVHVLPVADDLQLDLAALLAGPVMAEINELHVEAGPTLSGALLAADLVDELLLYQAPLLLGECHPMARLPAPASLDVARRWQWHSVQRVGTDLRLTARPSGREAF